MIISCSILSLSYGSYLDVPRINFAGRLRVDANTRNNMRCNYNPKGPVADPAQSHDTNVNGTNECSFVDTKVTSVVYPNGTTSTTDELVGSDVFDNDKYPFAKMIDLDVDIQGKSMVYGMKLGIQLQNGIVAFRGDWVPNVVSQNYWMKMKCYAPHHHGPHPFDISIALGAQATTRITNVTWTDSLNSPILQTLKERSESQTGELSVRLSFYFYTRSYQPFQKNNHTLAYIVGSIGAAKEGESLNFGGERILSPGQFPPPKKVRVDEHDSCYGHELQKFSPWLNKAPFKVDYSSKLLTVDLSNTLPINMHGSLRDLGQLQFGIFTTITSQYPKFCISPIGKEIPYLDNDWLIRTSGIVTYSLEDHQVSDLRASKLVIFQVIDEEDDSDDLGVPFCGETFHSIKGTHLAQILIEESQYFVRPLDQYVTRMEYGGSNRMSLLVTEYGFPAKNIAVEIRRSNPKAIPRNGITPDAWNVETDSNGHAVFTVQANEPIPYPRGYAEPPCPGMSETSLPIDGQIYLFKYCIESECPANIDFLFVSEFAFLVFSTVNYAKPYTWIDHVQPIFRQYYHLNKAMALVLNLSDYNSVTKPTNIGLIRLAMSQDFNNPNFMPVTRDLSPTKTRMILNWLDNPLYSVSRDDSNLTSAKFQTMFEHSSIEDVPSAYPRCQLDSFLFTSHPADSDPYFASFVSLTADSFLPLSGSNKDKSICTLENIRMQLQVGIEIKLHTIPLYLTSLYSIVDGSNLHVSSLLLKMAKREMRHLYQTGNMLRMLGGTPDFLKSNSPLFPRKGLPGNVLQDLVIDLKKASIDQLYKIFMVLNLPRYDGRSTGIDRVYSQLLDCLLFGKTADKINKMLESNENMVTGHIQSMWNGSNDFQSIESHSDAINAIINILSETDMIEDELSNNYPLFYQLEEAVCERELNANQDDYYSYSGNPLPFNNAGIWPMMDNPSWSAIQQNTNCYAQARIFEQVYHKLLLRIEESFTTGEDTFFEAIQLMESLHIHYKKVLWTEKDSASNETCGPIYN